MKEDQDQDHFPALSTIPCYTCSLSCPNLQSSQQEQVAIPREQLFGQQGQEEPYDHRLSIFDANQYTREERTRKLVPAKWMSSKLRIMRKMMGEDDRIRLIKQGSRVSPQDQALSNHHECSSNGNSLPTHPCTGIIRVCSNCSTTKTPLWRSGPQGPKSLCNACGIRQMKARRAMRAAAAAASAVGGGLVPAASAPKKVVKERSEVDRTVPFKKRFKIVATPSSSSPKKLRFDDVKIALSKKLAFNQAFPQEEKDAAMLLMALSCGLIHG